MTKVPRKVVYVVGTIGVYLVASFLGAPPNILDLIERAGALLVGAHLATDLTAIFKASKKVK
jgi:hypothetical protein